jgi:hypothetical protein
MSVLEECQEAIRLASLLGASSDVYEALDDGIGRFIYASETDHTFLFDANDTIKECMRVSVDDDTFRLVDSLREKLPFTWGMFCLLAHLDRSWRALNDGPDDAYFTDNDPDEDLSPATASRLWEFHEGTLTYEDVFKDVFPTS